MSIKSSLKTLPNILYNYFLLAIRSNNASPSDRDLSRLSSDELLSLMRHESHRIEKAAYNKLLLNTSKVKNYQEKRERLGKIYQILEERGYTTNEPTIAWSRQIYDTFDTLEANFILKYSQQAHDFDPTLVKPFINFLRERRSVRVWAEEQPDQSTLRKFALDMIDSARWAPNSGNRQAWRFLVFNNPKEKELLRKIKEDHCTTAPLLIFIGMDTRLYGALGKSERSVFIDAGAAIMQMILTAHKCGLGACWNHFADDLINSRENNRKIYADFAKYFKIPDYIAPIALVAIGRPKFIPPQPARMEIEDLLMHDEP